MGHTCLARLNLITTSRGIPMKQINKTSMACALGAVVLGSLALTSTLAEANPFGVQSLESGYSQFAPEGKCGEGKCGEDKAKKMKEGKCGEGKCGEDKAKKNERRQVWRREV